MTRPLERRAGSAVGLFIGIVLLLCVTTPAAIQDWSAPPPFPPPGQLVDLGGWRLHLHCTGESNPAQPTVVLEAGVGDFSVSWSLVQPGVARFARVCSYDRAGSGWSDLGPRPRTMRQLTWELHTLLEKAGVRPPYVLVGHSWGGMLARQYVATYPGEVAAMVLEDAGHQDGIMSLIDGKLVARVELATGRPIPQVKSADPLRASDIPPGARSQIEAAARHMGSRANEPPRDKLPTDVQRMRTWALSQPKHYAANDNPFEAEELAAMAAERKKEYPLGDLPLIVLSRGMPDDPSPRGQEVEALPTKNQATLVKLSRRSSQVIATRSGHHLNIDEPELVVTAIRDLVTAKRP